MKRKYLYSSVVAFLIIWFGVFAINTNTDGWKILPNSTIAIDVNGTCKVVENNWSNAFFIPTRTNNEWASFLSHQPGSSVVSDGVTPVCSPDYVVLGKCDSWEASPIVWCCSNMMRTAQWTCDGWCSTVTCQDQGNNNYCTNGEPPC